MGTNMFNIFMRKKPVKEEYAWERVKTTMNENSIMKKKRYEPTDEVNGYKIRPG